MRNFILTIAVVPAVLATGGCATYGPTWSEITGERYNVTILNRRPAGIQKVDGYSSYASYPIKLDPGKHEIELGAPVRGFPGGSPLRTLSLNLEPCMRYYLNAQFPNAVEINWQPVVDYVEPIAGCRTSVAAK